MPPVLAVFALAGAAAAAAAAAASPQLGKPAVGTDGEAMFSLLTEPARLLRAALLEEASGSSAADAFAVASARAFAAVDGGGGSGGGDASVRRHQEAVEDQARTVVAALRRGSGSGALPPVPRGRLGDPLEPGPQQVHLLPGATPATMRVMFAAPFWQKTGAVRFRRASPTAAWRDVAAVWTTYDAGVVPWKGSLFRADMTELAPDARYEYQVRVDSGDWSSSFLFTSLPAPGDTAPRTFALLADAGTAIPVGFLVTDLIEAESGPDKDAFTAIVHAGDDAYAGTGSTDEVEEVWDLFGDQIQKVASRMPYTFAVGNHEKYYNYSSFRHRVVLPGDEQGGRQNFWWYMEAGNTFFLYFSTEHDYDPGSPQHAFLVKTLSSVDRSKFPWLVLVGHRPLLCSDKGEWDSHHPGSHLVTVMQPLLLKYGVDLVVTGHMHMGERIHPTINATVQTHAISNDGHTYTNPGAPVMLVQATGGVFLDLEYVQPQPAWSAWRAAQWGYGRLTATPTTLSWEMRKWHSEGATLEATTSDYFVIKKE